MSLAHLPNILLSQNWTCLWDLQKMTIPVVRIKSISNRLTSQETEETFLVSHCGASPYHSTKLLLWLHDSRFYSWPHTAQNQLYPVTAENLSNIIITSHVNVSFKVGYIPYLPVSINCIFPQEQVPNLRCAL